MRKCQQAGIKVRMITGDNLLTAKSISREIGILTDGCAIEGPDFRRLDPDGQKEVLKTMQVRRLGVNWTAWGRRTASRRGLAVDSQGRQERLMSGKATDALLENLKIIWSQLPLLICCI